MSGHCPNQIVQGRKIQAEYTCRIFLILVQSVYIFPAFVVLKRAYVQELCTARTFQGYNSSGGTEIMLFVNDLSVYNRKCVQIYFQIFKTFFREYFRKDYLDPKEILRVIRDLAVGHITGKHFS